MTIRIEITHRFETEIPYPIYQQKQEERNQRNTLADSFRSLIGEYNEWMDSIQNEDAKVDLFLLNGFSRLFATGEKAAKG